MLFLGDGRMKKRYLLMLLLLSLLVACSGGGDSESASEESVETASKRTVTDYLGRKVEIPEQVESIVCVLESALCVIRLTWTL